MTPFISKERTQFLERSGLPFWNAYHQIGQKQIYYPYILNTCHKEEAAKIHKLQQASVKVAEIFNIVARRMRRWDVPELENWGFHKEYGDLLQVPWDYIFCMRVGWGWQGDQPKILEINSQTPSFWFELETGNRLFAQKFGLQDPTPGSDIFLRQSLNQAIATRLQELPEQRRLQPTVGFVSPNYWEDIDMLRWLASFCDYESDVLHIENLDFTKKTNIPFNRETGKLLDALIFWYPLEWLDDLTFASGEYVWSVFLDGLKRKSFVLVHGIPAFFAQSKAILAYITEHAKDLFVEEKSEAEQYFPKTYLSPDKLGGTYFAKPLWGREGRGSFIMKDGEMFRSRYQEDYYIQQQKVYQELLSLPKLQFEDKSLTVIYESWVYRVGDKFVPGGIGLRGSEHVITDDYCYFIPMGV
jgi:glutathionylspermidine synthase